MSSNNREKVTRETALYNCHPLVIVNEIFDTCMQYTADNMDELERALIEETAVKEKTQKLFAEGVDSMFTHLTEALNAQLVSFEEQALQQVFPVQRSISIDTINQAIATELLSLEKHQNLVPTDVKPSLSKVQHRLQKLGLPINTTKNTNSFSNMNTEAVRLERNELSLLEAEDNALDLELAQLSQKISARATYRKILQELTIRVQSNINSFIKFASKSQMKSLLPPSLTSIDSTPSTHSTTETQQGQNNRGVSGLPKVIKITQVRPQSHSLLSNPILGESAIPLDGPNTVQGKPDQYMSYPISQMMTALSYLKRLSQSTRELEHVVTIAGPSLFLDQSGITPSSISNSNSNSTTVSDGNKPNNENQEASILRLSQANLLAQEKYSKLLQCSVPLGLYFDTGYHGRETNDRVSTAQKYRDLSPLMWKKDKVHNSVVLKTKESSNTVSVTPCLQLFSLFQSESDLTIEVLDSNETAVSQKDFDLHNQPPVIRRNPTKRSRPATFHTDTLHKIKRHFTGGIDLKSTELNQISALFSNSAAGVFSNTSRPLQSNGNYTSHRQGMMTPFSSAIRGHPIPSSTIKRDFTIDNLGLNFSKSTK